MISAKDTARYFLAAADLDAGDLMSHLKLQKLCYYAQGFSLAMRGEPLFRERIEAWQHGPVIPDLWREYRDHGSSAIPAPENVDLGIYDEDVKELLNEVYEVYGQYSAWKLRNMTHGEPPWRDAWAKGPNTDISNDAMREYFDTLVDG